MGSFWGDPECKSDDKDVARFLEYIREITDKYSVRRKLKIATSALQAITAFVVHTHGPKEALALLDRLRREVMGIIQ